MQYTHAGQFERLARVFASMDRDADAQAKAMNRVLCSSPNNLLDYAERRTPLLLSGMVGMSLLLVGQGGGRSLVGVGDDLTDPTAQQWFCDHIAWLLHSADIAGYAICAPIHILPATPRADAPVPVVAVESNQGMIMIRANLPEAAKAALYLPNDKPGLPLKRMYETSGLCELPAPIPIFDNLYAHQSSSGDAAHLRHPETAKRETVH